MRADVFDPRVDPEPQYWAALRKQAGLRADWDWSVLTAQAWGARGPQVVTVLWDGEDIAGVVNAGWLGLPVHRNSFHTAKGRPRVGALHVRSPGTSAVPGWWFADGVPLSTLRDYGVHTRKALGPGCLGLVLRQVGDDVMTALPGRLRVARPTEPVWAVPIDGWADREEWLMSLRRGRRSDLRGIFRKMADNPGLRVEIRPGASDVDEVAAGALLRLNHEKYGTALFTKHRELSAHLRALLAQPDVVSLIYSEPATGRLLGFGVLLDHPEWPIAAQWAMLPVEDGGVKDLYFHFLASAIEWGIDTGKRGVILGKGKPRIKQTLGAVGTDQAVLAMPIPPR